MFQTPVRQHDIMILKRTFDARHEKTDLKVFVIVVPNGMTTTKILRSVFS